MLGVGTNFSNSMYLHQRKTIWFVVEMSRDIASSLTRLAIPVSGKSTPLRKLAKQKNDLKIDTKKKFRPTYSTLTIKLQVGAAVLIQKHANR